MFDPYHKWLGIPPEDQPPNLYRLLAINLFESDADVIDAAADRQMTYIRGCANGPYVAESQKMLNELSAARVCLLTPKKKIEYDRHLKAQHAAAEKAQQPAAEKAPQQSAENEELASIDLADFKSPKIKKRKASSKKRPKASIAPIGIGLLAIIGGIVFFSQTRPTPPSNPPVSSANVVVLDLPQANAVPLRPVTANVEPVRTPIQQWMNAVAAMPADEQVAAVRKKLMELNPSFDGQVKPKIEAGAVTEFAIVTDTISDISPIRALTQLKFLDCGSSGRTSQFSDLSPLKGMSLQKLHANATKVSDVSPLAEMPLKALSIANTLVSELAPLRALRLVSLDCAGTQIADLSPLKGMPLDYLAVQSSRVSDLSPLIGMPLKLLNLEHTSVSNLSPIKGMPLELLGCPFTQVSDLSPVTGMSLKHLYCNDTPISDLSPLQGMPLKRISITPRNIRVGIDTIRTMKSLENISLTWVWENNSPPELFWKQYDAGQFK